MLARALASLVPLAVVFSMLYFAGYTPDLGLGSDHPEMTQEVEDGLRDEVKAKRPKVPQGPQIQKPSWLVLGGEAVAESRAAARATTAKKATSCASKQAMPNLVGMDAEEAQELMDRRGALAFYKTDVTGRRRALLWDRNWLVVRQSPDVCTQIDKDTTVDVWTKKKTDTWVG